MERKFGQESLCLQLCGAAIDCRSQHAMIKHFSVNCPNTKIQCTIDGCQAQVVRCKMKDHMEGNMHEHLQLICASNRSLRAQVAELLPLRQQMADLNQQMTELRLLAQGGQLTSPPPTPPRAFQPSPPAFSGMPGTGPLTCEPPSSKIRFSRTSNRGIISSVTHTIHTQITEKNQWRKQL